MGEIIRFQPRLSESGTDGALATQVEGEKPFLQLVSVPQEHERLKDPADFSAYRAQKLGADLQAVQVIQEEFNTELGIVPNDKTNTSSSQLMRKKTRFVSMSVNSWKQFSESVTEPGSVLGNLRLMLQESCAISSCQMSRGRMFWNAACCIERNRAQKRRSGRRRKS